MEKLYEYINNINLDEMMNKEIEIYFEDISNNNLTETSIKELKEIKIKDENKLKKILKQLYINIKIKQDRYLNQIRDIINNNSHEIVKIYTVHYKFIKSINISTEKNIIIFEVSKTYLNEDNFPNLNKYDISKTIQHTRFESDYIDYIINDNIQHLEIKLKNKKIDKNKINDLLTEILNLI